MYTFHCRQLLPLCHCRPTFMHSAFQPNLSAAFLFFILLIAFLIISSLILSFLSPFFCLFVGIPLLLYTAFVFPHLSLNVLFSVDFHNISCISLKSVMNFRFCCFFHSMRCLVFSLNLSFNFLYFSSIFYI